MESLDIKEVSKLFSTEERLAFALAFKANISGINNSFDFKEIIAQSKKHGILPLIDKSTFKQVGIDSNHFTETAERVHNFCLANQLKQIGELKTLSNILKAENIKFILVKGLDIAYRYYKEPYKRYAVDLDILIDQEDLVRAYSLLKKHGFDLTKGGKNNIGDKSLPNIIHHCRYFKEVLSFEKDKCEIDIHPIDSIKFKTLLNSTETREIKDQSYLSLSEKDSLEFILRHARKHNYHKALWFYDLNLIFKNLSEEELREHFHECIKRGVGRDFQVAVIFAHILCDLEISTKSTEEILSDPHCENLSQLVCSQLSRTDESWQRVIFNLKTQMSFRLSIKEKIGVLIKKALLPTLADFSYINLPRGFSILYPFMRPVRFLDKCTRQILGNKKEA